MKIKSNEFLSEIKSELILRMALEIEKKKPNSKIAQILKKIRADHKLIKWKADTKIYKEVSDDRIKKLCQE